jgi:sulfur-carrier protein adenylyltransferase/sulfurtransferase
MTVREISVKELKAKMDRGEEVFLLDVREPSEREIATLGGLNIPLAQIATKVADIPRDKEVVVYCRSGGRSGKAVQELQSGAGFTNLYNLKGGVLAWSDEIDPSMAKY